MASMEASLAEPSTGAKPLQHEALHRPSCGGRNRCCQPRSALPKLGLAVFRPF